MTEAASAPVPTDSDLGQRHSSDGMLSVAAEVKELEASEEQHPHADFRRRRIEDISGTLQRAIDADLWGQFLEAEFEYDKVMGLLKREIDTGKHWQKNDTKVTARQKTESACQWDVQEVGFLERCLRYIEARQVTIIAIEERCSSGSELDSGFIDLEDEEDEDEDTNAGGRPSKDSVGSSQDREKPCRTYTDQALQFTAADAMKVKRSLIELGNRPISWPIPPLKLSSRSLAAVSSVAKLGGYHAVVLQSGSGGLKGSKDSLLNNSLSSLDMVKDGPTVQLLDSSALTPFENMLLSHSQSHGTDSNVGFRSESWRSRGVGTCDVESVSIVPRKHSVLNLEQLQAAQRGVTQRKASVLSTSPMRRRSSQLSALGVGLRPSNVSATGPDAMGILGEEYCNDSSGDEAAEMYARSIRGAGQAVIGNLMPRLVGQQAGDTLITVHVEKLILPDIDKYLDPFITVSVKDSDGFDVTKLQDTPVSNRREKGTLWYRNDVEIQKTLRQLKPGMALFFEFKHFKLKKDRNSTYCFTCIPFEQFNPGVVQLTLYRKPVDYRRKKLKALDRGSLCVQMIMHDT
eukprot:Clim_evm77s201 gene=Clim_evmTU77s201